MKLHFLTILPYIAFSVLMMGCQSNPVNHPTVSQNLLEERERVFENQQKILDARMRIAECMIRYNEVSFTCLAAFSGSANGLALQNQLVHCIQVKGFPNGADSCH